MIKYTILLLLLAAGGTAAVVGSIDPESLANYSEIGIAVVSLLLTLCVGLAVVWWRNLRVVARSVLAEESSRDASLQPVVIIPARSVPAPAPVHGRARTPPADIQVCDSLSDVEQASLLLGFGRWHEAGEALAAVAPRPAESVGHYIALLHRGMEFDVGRPGRKSVLPPFNVAWTGTSGQAAARRSLEDYPHVVAAIEKHWGRLACAVYLDLLLLDTRGGKRSGFPVAVAEELVLLRSVLDECLREEPRGGSRQVSGSEGAANPSFAWELRYIT